MEPIVLLLLGLLAYLVAMPIIAVTKASGAKRRANELAEQMIALDRELRILQKSAANGVTRLDEMGRELAMLKASGIRVEPEKPAAPAPVPVPKTPVQAPEISAKVPEIPVPAPEVTVQAPAVEPVKKPVPEIPSDIPASHPSHQPSRPVPVDPPRPASIPSTPINWEQFMGAKLFAWIGGLAGFLGVAFFVKYSFEHDLIPPEIRVAIGFMIGVALLIGGVLMTRKETAVTAQTLCSTGVLTLYGVTFACRSIYHFAFFGPGPTFLLMSLITAVAFLLSVRLNAMVIAVLGIAGGFLTPVLLSTGQDQPLGLFAYIALLDVGLLAVALRQRWTALPALGALGTILMQSGWVSKFFVKEAYFADNKVLIAMAVFGGFQALFLAATAIAKRSNRLNPVLSCSALGLGLAALISAFFYLSFPALGNRPVLLFSYAFLIHFGLLTLVFTERTLAGIEAVLGMGLFVFLAMWTHDYFKPEHLHAALGFYLLFAIFYSAAPVVMHRVRGMTLPWWSNAFPALALLLVMMPIFKLTALSILIWPLVLCIDVLAIVLAVITAAMLPILMVLALTLIVTGAWIFRIPSELTGLPTSLFMVGGFAIFFIVAATWACRKLASKPGLGAGKPELFGDTGSPANLSVQIPALSATLPFLLLIMLTLRLPLINPSPVFGLALLLVVLLLGLAKIMSLEALPAVGLACVIALEHTWHFHHFNPANAVLPLAWYLVFYAVFTVFPFLFHRQFEKSAIPWAVAALAGPLHFYLLHHLVRAAYPGISGMMGLLPAVFAIPSLLGVIVILNRTPEESPARNTQLAWFGGIALFFITLIFPIQFDRQWITIGWALEGVALCWLFHRVPHPGLRLTGVGLLVVAFSRLALNPAVLSYHPHSATPILNWYLYAYGITALCLFTAARLLAPPRHLVGERDVRPGLYTLGTVLAFLLVNIEIADFFSKPGTTVLTFEFSGDFGRDMSYSIAWALFALLLLVIGIAKRLAPVRYASIGLLGVTLLKLFGHDLSQLDQLYRIAAFIVVAIIAMLASYLYQRFLAAPAKAGQPQPEPESPLQ